MVEQMIDGVTFHLKVHHDFSWLKSYGRVFKVFDHQTSGNICFGLEDQGKRYFLKYAGAETILYKGEARDAIQYLRRAGELYQVIRHDNLIQIMDQGHVGAGYMLLFKWQAGESLHDMTIPKGEKYSNPKSPNYRFDRLPMEEHMACLDRIYDFHRQVSQAGYVAVDFYDGSLMYDFQTCKLTICDVDVYRKGPSTNDMGRMWGSSRLMAPEEFALGAPIDEITNVYLMGALAFEFLGNSRSKDRETWKSSEVLYQVANRAVSQNREDRYPSLSAFYRAWYDGQKGRKL